MTISTLEKKLARERQKVAALEQLIEDKTRSLYLSAENLRESQRYLETVHRAMPGALLVFDTADVVTDANEAALSLLAGSAVDCHMDLIVSEPLPELEDHDRREASLRRFDGRPVVVLLSRRRLTEDGRQLWVAVDLTEQKALEAKLRHAQKLQSIGTLAAGLAHELNTPIQYLQDNLSFLEESYGDYIELFERARGLIDGNTSDAQRRQFDDQCAVVDVEQLHSDVPEALSSMRVGLRRVGEIVRAMRVFSHPQSEVCRGYDVNSALRDVGVIASSEYRGIAELELDLGEIQPVECRGDDFNTVFLNLIVNAAHAIKSAERTDGRIRIRSRSTDDGVEVAVQDNGTGIPESIKSRIFDPFFTTKPVGKGTGQGLAMVHGIVTGHGGSIHVDSTESVGTTFRLMIPSTPRRSAGGPA